MNTQRRSFGRRINAWLQEDPNEIFRDGKWRFWFPTLIGLTALNAVMTAVIFGQDGMQKYIGSIVILAGAVLCWLALGLLHYSDSSDRLLAIGVAALDSLSLLFIAAHFSFLLWCQGHLWTLRAAEEKYQQDLSTYNSQITPISADNARITAAAERIAEIEKQTERLRNDTAYWSRRNGVRQTQSGIKVELSTTKVELSTTKVEIPPPPKAPEESSAGFLSGWDAWIRFTGFGELALSIITLIFFRTRTAARNRIQADEVFPDELDAEVTQNDRTGRRFDRTRKRDSGIQSPLSLSFDREKARYALLEHLKTVSFHYPRHTFKVDLIAGGVIIRMVRKEHGVETTVASTTQSNKLLAAVDRPDFRERLVDELIHQNFPIEKDDVI